MINWVETEKQCGVTEITATKQSRVVAECDSCHFILNFALSKLK
jgi:hypothetical protein